MKRTTKIHNEIVVHSLDEIWNKIFNSVNHQMFSGVHYNVCNKIKSGIRNPVGFIGNDIYIGALNDKK